MQSIDSSQKEIKHPFLSVVIRTQGKRIECLKDALLCLTAQSDQNFEVVLVQHGKTASREVQEVLDMQPESFKNKISFLSVSGGKRAVPLNAGVNASRGEYIAFFDDDDLLFANWVEEFKSQSSLTPQTVLRSQVATVQAELEMWPLTGGPGLRTLSWPHAEYAKSFSRVDHLLVNHSPFMGLAFPRILFTQQKLFFDEELDVCEDWDFLLRASASNPVSDVSSLTALYRRWTGQETSYTLHDKDDWNSSEQAVISKFLSSEVTLRGVDIFRVRELLTSEQQLSQLQRLLDLEQKFNQMEQSLSWKITILLRWVRSKLKYFFK